MTTPRYELWDCIQPYILVGGLSKRFGSDKSLALIENEIQINRLWKAIAADFCQAPILIQRAHADSTLLKYPAITDQITSQGPLCGIAAGLAHLSQRRSPKQSFALFVTCDLFQWSRQVAEGLVQAIAVNNQAEIVSYKTSNGIEPFPSVWSAMLAEDVLATATSEDRSIIRFIQRRNVCTVSLHDSQQIACFNTPEQLKELQRRRS